MRVLIVLMLLLSGGGCQVATISPLYTQESVHRDDRIEGVWLSEKEEGVTNGEYLATVRRLPCGSYSVVIGPTPSQEAAGEAGAFEIQATLVEVGGMLCVDVEAPLDELQQRLGEFLAFVMPLHYIARAELSDQRLTLSMMDTTWLDSTIKKHPNEIAYVRADLEPAERRIQANRIHLTPPPVLTGSTEEIREFLSRRGTEAGVWAPFHSYANYQSLLPDDPGEQ